MQAGCDFHAGFRRISGRAGRVRGPRGSTGRRLAGTGRGRRLGGRRARPGALENPIEYPPLRQAIVPGDRVVDRARRRRPRGGPRSSTPSAGCSRSAGVEPESITVLALPRRPARPLVARARRASPYVRPRPRRPHPARLPRHHDRRAPGLPQPAADRRRFRPPGRPARVRPGPRLPRPLERDLPRPERHRDPALVSAGASDAAPDPQQPGPLFKESAEVSWLLGCQFQVGLVAGVSGAGRGRRRAGDGGHGSRARGRSMTPGGPGRVAGRAGHRRGRPARRGDGDRRRGRGRWPRPTRLVQRGGKIVVLSRAAGELGPAMRRLIAVGRPARRPVRAAGPRVRRRLRRRPPARAGPGLGRRLPAQRARPRTTSRASR